MHISEFQIPSNTILTKCSKMTEEGHRLHGMNGNADRNIKEECHKTNYGQGGRLKFFKDGKFILELERAREGERVSWVSVPRKTFWPPQGTATSTPAYRQESSTSLSVSDDNSSIQSSPWQRDHSWKQTNPTHNISKEMTMYFWRPKGKRSGTKRSIKRRNPHSAAPEYKVDNERTFVRMKKDICKRTLSMVIQSLIERNYRTSTSPRSETVVSPRKRFLREMEKDKAGGGLAAEEYASVTSLKRSRSKPQYQPSINSHQPTPSPLQQQHQPPAPSLAAATTNGDSRPPTRNCSYSITSLLAEDRRRSPSSSPGNYSPAAAPQYHTPPVATDDRWYSESVDRLRCIELSQADKHVSAYPPYHHPHGPPSYLGPYVYPFHPPPTGPPFFYDGGGSRGYVVPTMYHHHHQAMSARRETPACPWAVGHVTRDGEASGETVTDMPLNLSKHSS